MRVTLEIAAERMNGIAASAIQIPGALSTGVTLAFGHGSAVETIDRAGFAHLTEHLLHSATRAGPRLTEDVVADLGGMSNAQSYPFHTEFSLVLPASDVRASLAAALALATSRLQPLTLSSDAIEREVRVIAREVDERLSSGSFATFPWVGTLAAVSCDEGTVSNPFSDLRALTRATTDEVEGFVARTQAAPVSLAVASSLHPAEALDLVRDALVDHVRTVDYTDWRRGFRGHRLIAHRFTARHGSESVASVSAEFRVLPESPDRARARALAAVLPGILAPAAGSGTAWSTGLFGAWTGPEFDLFTAWRFGAGADPDLGVEAEARESVSRLTEQTLDQARMASASEFSLYLSGTAPASALLARDALFGIDTRATPRLLNEVTALEIERACETLCTIKPGVLSWTADPDLARTA